MISTGVAVLITLIFLAAGICAYESNDDMGMILILSGQQGIPASSDAVFMSIPLGALLQLLYRLNLTIPWYGLVMYAALIVGCSIGLHVIIEASTEIRNRIICTLAFLGLYMVIVTRLNFASVSLFLWFSVCARIAQTSLSRQTVGAVNWLYGCMLGFSYLIRPDIIQTVTPMFSLPVLAALYLSPSKKRLIAVLLPLVFIVFVAVVWAQTVRNTPEYSAYKEFNNIRSMFNDTSQSDWDWNSRSQQALATTGWNISDYYLAKEFLWFHDSTLFSAHKLETFMQYKDSSITSIFDFQTRLEDLRQYVFNLIIVILSLTALLIGRHDPPSFVRSGRRLVSCALIITLINLLLLSMIRFPPRVALPVFACLVLSALVFRPFLGGVLEIRSGRLSWTIWSILCAAVLVTTVSLYRSGVQLLTNDRVIKTFADQSIRAVQRVAGDDTIFMLMQGSFGHESLNPLKEYRDMVPLRIFPGGWMIGSPGYNAFLRANGLIDREHVVPKMVNNPKIVLAFWETQPQSVYKICNLLQQHLQLHYGAQFPGATLVLDTVLDKRIPLKTGPYGWVFYAIKTVPHSSGSGAAP